MWTSDGTTAGTQLAAAIRQPIPMLDLGGHAMVIGSGTHNGVGTGVEIFISNDSPTDCWSLEPRWMRICQWEAWSLHSRQSTRTRPTRIPSLVAGEGDTDNANFTIVGNQLVTATPLDFETKPIHDIRISATDSIGATIEKPLTVNVFSSSLFKDVHPGEASADPQNFTPLGSQWLFSATTPGGGSGLYVSDRTADGTTLLKGFAEVPGTDGIREMTVHDGNVYFVVDDAIEGVELWRTDGDGIRNPQGYQLR